MQFYIECNDITKICIKSLREYQLEGGAVIAILFIYLFSGQVRKSLKKKIILNHLVQSRFNLHLCNNKKFTLRNIFNPLHNKIIIIIKLKIIIITIKIITNKKILKNLNFKIILIIKKTILKLLY